MKFEWDNEHTLEWTQQPNPLSVTNVNLNSCENNGCTTTGNAKTTDFNGLSISSNPSTLLDGVLDGSWFYAVGVNTGYGRNIPSWTPNSATSAKLYVLRTVQG